MAGKARVFISCGQKDGPECDIADRIKKVLANDLKFESDDDWPYVAKLDPSLKILLPEIFKRLKESEYFIFLDFNREQVLDEKGEIKGVRGSLFTHQELAITTYLDISRICFRAENLIEEKNSLKREGMCSQLLDNIPADQIFPPIDVSCTKEKREEIIVRVVDIVTSKVKQLVKNKQWNPNWRNELYINRDDFLSSSPIWDDDGNRCLVATRYYHIKIRNCHRDKIARNCVIFLGKVEDLQGEGKPINLDIAEMKWTGIRTRDAFISPGSDREFDLLRVATNWTPRSEEEFRQRPEIPGAMPFLNVRCNFNRELVDSGPVRGKYQIVSPCHKRLHFTVFSDNFYPLKFTLDLKIEGNKFQDINITLAKQG